MTRASVEALVIERLTSLAFMIPGSRRNQRSIKQPPMVQAHWVVSSRCPDALAVNMTAEARSKHNPKRQAQLSRARVSEV